MTTAFAHHWQMMLAAAVVGLVLGAAFVAVYYLAAPVRLCLTISLSERERLLRREFVRLRRLGDEAAVLGEHDLAGAGELREEAGLREMLLRHACAWGRDHRGR